MDIDVNQLANSLNNRADRDLNNLSQSGKENITGLCMPDYSKSTQLAYDSFSGSGWVAPSNGVIMGSVNWRGPNKFVIVNGSNTIGGNTETCIFFLPVSKGDVVTQTSADTIESSYTYLSFFPLKGAN